MQQLLRSTLRSVLAVKDLMWQRKRMMAESKDPASMVTRSARARARRMHVELTRCVACSEILSFVQHPQLSVAQLAAALNSQRSRALTRLIGMRQFKALFAAVKSLYEALLST